MCGIGYGCRCQQYEPEGQQADRAAHPPEFMPGSIPGRGIEQWRQKDDEHDIGVQPDQRDTGYHTDTQPGDHQENRIGDPQLVAQHRQHRDDEEQGNDQQKTILQHTTSIP
jgi:hypothetical protein